MKPFKLSLVGALLMSGAGLVRADTYTVTFNLSNLNPGSTLSGVIDTTGALMPGDTANATLSFNDPSDYSTPTLSTVLTVGSGIFTDTFRFSTMTFEDLTDNQTVNLEVDVSARCFATPTGLPCFAIGRWQDDDPAELSGWYSVVGAEGSQDPPVPEPSYAVASLILVALIRVHSRLKV